jgi:polar amino acid transport system substrate-binding protein
LPDPPAVIEAVNRGEADIGFVAFAPERVGMVDFSQVYMLVQQSFLVREDSGLRSIAEVDRAGLKIAGTKNDSITLFMKRKFRNATLREIDNDPAEINRHGQGDRRVRSQPPAPHQLDEGYAGLAYAAG